MKRPGARAPGLFVTFGARKKLSGARALDDVDPGLITALKRRERVLRGGGDELAELGQLADIGFERRLGEFGLQFEGFMHRLGTENRLAGSDRLFNGALGIGIKLDVDAFDALARDGGGLHVRFSGVLAVTDNTVIAGDG